MAFKIQKKKCKKVFISILILLSKLASDHNIVITYIKVTSHINFIKSKNFEIPLQYFFIYFFFKLKNLTAKSHNIESKILFQYDQFLYLS